MTWRLASVADTVNGHKGRPKRSRNNPETIAASSVGNIAVMPLPTCSRTAATVDAIKAQLDNGITAMLPTENALAVSQDLADRFGLPLWQYTVSATDANRHVIRYSRLITGRSKIVVIDRCYHGSVDETFATLDAKGVTVSREGNIGAPILPSRLTVNPASSSVANVSSTDP